MTIVPHTPGPWATETDKRFRSMSTEQLPESIGIRGPDGMFLAATYDFNRYDRDAEVEANARLIAAAPDLLAALESVLRAFTDAEADRIGIERDDAWKTKAGIPPWIERIVMPAIRKAKGGAS